MKVSEWAFDRIKEAFEKVAQDEAEKVSVVQEIMLEVQTTCGESSRQLEDKEDSQCLTCARMATVSLWKTTFGGSLVEKIQGGGARSVCGEKYDWKQPNRL